MKIKNKRSFYIGCLTFILTIICVIAYVNTREQKYLISSILAILYAMINVYYAFQKKGLVEEIAEHVDERDQYLVMKTSHLSIRIVTMGLCTLTFTSLLLYGIYKYPPFLIISCTLCFVIIITFLVYLLVNMYLEKHE